MARAAIIELIAGDSIINALGISTPQIYSSNTTDSPSHEKPFLTINIADEPKAYAGQTSQEYEIWCHVPESLVRDYGIVDEVLARIKVLMLSAVHVDGADGWTLSSASFQGTSGDLKDDGYQSLCRRSSYRVASRYTGITP